MGKPGSSYTFEVATKIGLPKTIIRAAKQKIDGRKVKLDSLLVTLQARENELNRQKEELKRQQEVLRFETDLAKGELARYQAKARELEYEATKVLVEKGKLYDSLLAFWQKTKDKEALLKKIVTSSEKEETKVLKQKEAKKKQQKAQQREQAKEVPPKPIVAGDIVHLVKSKQLGVVQEINKDKATVVFGMMKTIVPLKDLRHGK
jgi:DNA mismatch repair protein MutS2